MATAHVQSNDANFGSFTTIQVAFPGNVTAGNLIAVYLFITSTTPVFSSCTDTLGNTYTLVDSVAGSSGKAFTCYAKNIGGGANTVTIALDSQNFNSWVAVSEISGADTSAPLDGHNMTANEDPGTATDAVTSGTATTTVNGDYIFGGTAEAGFGSVITVGTGFTSRATGVGNGETIESLIQSTAGSIAATFTSNSSGADYVTAMMAFKPAATVSAALTGTAVGGITEGDVVAGGKTIIITLTGDTFISN